MNKSNILCAKSAIINADESYSLMDIIDSERESFCGARLLYSTENAGVQLNDFADQELLTGLFSNSRLLAFSDEIMKQMNNNDCQLLFKQRVIFDTNLISDLPKYFNNESLSTREKIEKILSIVKHSFAKGYDFSFPMLENLRKFTESNNSWPIYKVAASFYLDEKLQNTALSNKPFSYKDTPTLFEKSEKLWDSFRGSEHVWKQIDRRDLIYVILLKTMDICWSSSNLTIENALEKIVQFCIDELNVLPLKELYFAWKAIVGFLYSEFTPIFNESPLKSPNKKTLDRISALSWDLFLFRFTETLFSEEKGNSFYVPSVTTLDTALLDTIKLCPIKAVLMYDDIGYVETIFSDELNFQHCLAASTTQKQKEILDNEKRAINNRYTSRYRLQMAILKYEKNIKNHVSAALSG